MYSIELTAQHRTPGDIVGIIPFKIHPQLQLQYGGCGAIIQDTTLRGASDEVRPLPPGARRLVRNTCYVGALSLDEQTVFLGLEKVLCAVDIATGAETCRVKFPRATEAVAMHPSGTLLAICIFGRGERKKEENAGGDGRGVVILETANLTEWCAPVIASELDHFPQRFEFSHCGTMLAVGGGSSVVQILQLDMEARTLHPMRSFSLPSKIIFAFAFSYDDRLLAAAGNFGVKVFQSDDSGSAIADIGQVRENPIVMDVRFLSNNHIVSCCDDGHLRLHSMTLNREVLVKAAVHQGQWRGMQKICCVREDGKIFAWRPHSGSEGIKMFVARQI